jgi:glycosyltransferase involved in cell wall biosynthesis
MPRARICHLATSFTDGAGIAAKRIHEALLASDSSSRLLVRDKGNHGPEIHVTGQSPYSLVERLARRLSFYTSGQARREQTLQALLSRPGPAPELFSLPNARSTPEDHPWTREADIIHLHWVAGFVDVARFLRRRHQPIVWTLHDQHPYLGGFHYELDHGTHPAFHALDNECRNLKRSAMTGLGQSIVAVGNSKWNTAAARSSGTFPTETRFETVYYPLDHHAYAPRDKTAAKISLGLDARRLVVGFACTGLENTRKGLGDLLDALHILERTPAQPAITLLSFGRPPPANLRTKLHSRWQHLGFLDADTVKCSAYSAMDCFVIPSRAEAFGQTAIEALASGTCVVGSDVGGIPETLPRGAHTEVLFPPGDVSALAARLRTVLADPALREALAAQGRAHVCTQHDPVDIAKKMSSIYSSLLTR